MVMTHAAKLDAIITKVIEATKRADSLQSRLDATDRREVERLAESLRAEGKNVSLNKDSDGYLASVSVDGIIRDVLSFAEWARGK